MRILRLMLYLVVGIVLGSVTVLAFAETIPATVNATGVPKVRYQNVYDTLAEAAAAKYASYRCQGNTETGADVNPVTAPSTGNISFYCYAGSGTTGTKYTANIVYGMYCATGTLKWASGIGHHCQGALSCPDSSWTLSGTQCSRPDCVGAEVRNENGICQMPSCNVPENQNFDGVYSVPYPQTTGRYCINGCAAFGPWGNTTKSNGRITGSFTSYGTSCTVTDDVGASITPKSDPPCAQGEGVIALASGEVKCVAAGTPGPTTPPVVNKSSKTDTFPDGSQKITNTTQTCTGEGACSTTTTVTVTNNSSGGAGQAGTPGTTTSKSNTGGKTGDADTKSAFCSENPNLQMCKGGMAEEGTQKQVLAEVKKLTTAPNDTHFANGDDFDGGGLEGVDPDAKAALDATYKSREDALKMGFDPQTFAPKSDQQILGVLEGWFTDIPTGGCQVPEYEIAGHRLVLDNWCEQAEKISSIGAYALWFMTAIGLFTMVTGGKGET